MCFSSGLLIVSVFWWTLPAMPKGELAVVSVSRQEGSRSVRMRAKCSHYDILTGQQPDGDSEAGGEASAGLTFGIAALCKSRRCPPACQNQHVQNTVSR